MKVNFKNKRFQKRVMMSLIGVILSGISVGIFKTAVFGVDPFTVVVSGIDAVVPIEYGMVYIIINAVLLMFSVIFDRRNIGIATFINLFLIGYITQFSTAFFGGLFPDPGMSVRVVCFVVGIVILCFGSSLYMTAELGVSTYDAIAITCSGKFHLGQFRFVRITTDVICVVLGSILYYIGTGEAARLLEVVGVGTILTAFFMGPLIDWFNRKFSRPFLER